MAEDRAFYSRFDGSICKYCSQRIKQGERITWNRRVKGLSPWHYFCDPVNAGKGSQTETPEIEEAASEPLPNFVKVNPPSDTSIGSMLADFVAPYLEGRLEGLVNEERVMDLIAKTFGEMVFQTVNTIQIQEPDLPLLDMGVQHKQFAQLLKCMQARTSDGYRLNVWLVGSAGSGKTYAAKECARALGLEFYFTGSIDTEYKLSGFVDAQGRLVSTAFRKAYEKGGVFLFDECDSSLPAALLAFNAALANGECAFPDGIVARHPDFVCIAAANTWGLGATVEYVGRIKLDAAFLDRFVQLHWEIDEALELATSGNADWCKRVQRLRANAKAKGLKVMISPRASYFGAALLGTGMEQGEVEAMTVRKAMTLDQWQSIQY